MSDNDSDVLPDWQLYVLMILMLCFGTANTLVMKYQDQYEVEKEDGGSTSGKFTHPYFQCANMFVGELCCLIVYFSKKFWAKRR